MPRPRSAEASTATACPASANAATASVTAASGNAASSVPDASVDHGSPPRAAHTATPGSNHRTASGSTRKPTFPAIAISCRPIKRPPSVGSCSALAPSSCRQERRLHDGDARIVKSRPSPCQHFRVHLHEPLRSFVRQHRRALDRHRSHLQQHVAGRKAGSLDDRTPLGDSEHGAEHDGLRDSRCDLGVTSDKARPDVFQRRMKPGKELPDRNPPTWPAARARRPGTIGAVPHTRRRRWRSRERRAERRPTS